MSLDLPRAEDPFDARDPEEIAGEVLNVDVEGFEGPLDMLLAMARTQKVDLSRISVLKLAEQYLAFVAEARRLRIELAADYLVMAAWLAWLKSRLLLPPPAADEEPSGEEMAERLALRLERLDAMRKAAARLMARDLLGRDVFARGAPERLGVHRTVQWEAGLGDLLAGYARLRTRDEYRPLAVGRVQVFEIDAALARLRKLMGGGPDWQGLESFLPEDWCGCPERRRAAVAASFAASLELAKQGEVELRQESAFAPIYLRRAGEGMHG